MSLRVKSLYRQKDSIAESSLHAKDYIKKTFRKSLRSFSSNPSINSDDGLLNPVQTTPLPIIEDLDLGGQFGTEFRQFKTQRTPRNKPKELTPEWMKLAEPVLVSPIQIPSGVQTAPPTQSIEAVPNLSNDTYPSTPATLTTNPSHEPPELVISPHPHISTVPLADLLKPVQLPNAIQIDSEGRTLLQSPNPPRPSNGPAPPQLPNLDTLLDSKIDASTFSKIINSPTTHNRTKSLPNLLFISNTNEDHTGYTFSESYPKVPKLQAAPKSQHARRGSCHLPNPTTKDYISSENQYEEPEPNFLQNRERRKSTPEIGTVTKLESIHNNTITQKLSHPVGTEEFEQKRASILLEKAGNGKLIEKHKTHLKSLKLISKVKNSIRFGSLKVAKGFMGKMNVKEIFSS
jgi:hypothetical protein